MLAVFHRLVLLEFSFCFLVDAIRNGFKVGVEALHGFGAMGRRIDVVSQLTFHLK